MRRRLCVESVINIEFYIDADEQLKKRLSLMLAKGVKCSISLIPIHSSVAVPLVYSVKVKMRLR